MHVEELHDGGSVPELRVANEGTSQVLILEEDELIGAKQNRVVNSSVLVAADSELVLPVSCVERGRWSYRSRAFTSGKGSPHLVLRRLETKTVHDFPEAWPRNGMEKEMVEAARTNFEEYLGKPAVPALTEAEWLERVAFPLDRGGEKRGTHHVDSRLSAGAIRLSRSVPGLQASRRPQATAG